MISISFCICAAGAAGVVGASAAGADGPARVGLAVALDLLVEVSPERDLRTDHRPGRRADDQVGVAELHALLREPDRESRLPGDAHRSAAAQHHCTSSMSQLSALGCFAAGVRHVSSPRYCYATLAWHGLREAGSTVGSRRLKNSATSASTASTASADRSPSRRAVSFSSTIAVVVFGGDAGVVERGFEVGVGDERDTARQLGLRLRRQVVRHGGVAGDPVEERAREGGDEHGAGERGPDRRTEVRHGVLNAADLAGLLVGNRRDGHGARAATRARRCRARRAAWGRSRSRRPRPLRARRPRRRGRRRARGSRAGRRGAATRSGTPSGTPAAASRSVIESGSRRTPVSIALEAERDRQVERDHEEQPGLQQVLEEERGEAAAELPDPQQCRIDERRATPIDQPLLPGEEQPHDDAAAEEQPDHRGQAEQLGCVGLRAARRPRRRPAGPRTR